MPRSLSAIVSGTGAPDANELDRIAAAFELVEVPMVLVRPDGTIHSANPSVGFLFGLDEGVLIDQASLGFVAETERDANARARVFARGETSRVHRRIIIGGRGAFEVDAVARPVRGESGAVIGAALTLVAATSERAAVAAADEQRRIVETLADAVIVTDRHGRIRSANRAAERLLGGVAPGVLEGRRLDSIELLDRDGRLLSEDRHPIWMALSGEIVPTAAYPLRVGQTVHHVRLSAQTLVAGGSSGAGAVVTFADVTDDVHSVASLSASERRFRTLAHEAPVGIFESDHRGHCTYVNPEWSRLTGAAVDDVLGERWLDAVHRDDLELVRHRWSRSVATGEDLDLEFRFRRPDGTDVPVGYFARPVRDADGDLTMWLGTIIDRTRQHQLHAELEANERRFRELADGSADIVMRVRLSPLSIEYVSRAIEPLTGLTPEELYARPITLFEHIHPDDVRELRRHLVRRGPVDHQLFRVRSSDGAYRYVESRNTTTLGDDGRPITVDCTMRDVTDTIHDQQMLEALAHRDPLTGLHNRRSLEIALQHRLAEDQPTAVLFFDLDGFKHVNDTHGHHTGDRVLHEFAKRLERAVRIDDTVARLAGDEFVILADPSAAAAIAERLHHDLTQPIATARGPVRLTVSVGIAHLDPERERSIDDVLQRADRAMYVAKRSGGSTVTVA